MEAFILCASILCTLIATGHSLSCVVCSNRTSLSCSGELKECGADVTSCETAIVESEFVGQGSNFNIFKNCSHLPKCEDIHFIEHSVVFNYQLKRRCCDDCGCNTADMTFPPKNTTLNGVRCPACFALNVTHCEPQETVDCVGDLTKCIHVGGTGRVNDGEGFKFSDSACVNIENAEQFPVFPGGTVDDVENLKVSDGI